MASHDCGKCRLSESYRAEHGCDEETEHPQMRLACWRCGESRNANCALCGGSGDVVIRRCPRALLREWGWERFKQAYWAAGKGLWPDEGGLMDQSAEFVEAAKAFDELLAKQQSETETDG